MIQCTKFYAHARTAFSTLGLTAMLGFLSVGQATAATGTLAQAIEQCSKESNSLKRLVCFDRVARSVRQYSEGEQLVGSIPPAVVKSSKAAPQRPAVVMPQTNQYQAPQANDAEQQFGLEHKQDTDEMIEKLFANISQITTDQRGKRIITLDNGQIWKQNDGSALKLSVSERVFIDRGVLGAFYLGKDGLNRRMKVKRVK